MSGRDWQLPVGDRDHEDNRGAREPRRVDPETPVNMPVRLPNEGLGTFLARCEREGLLLQAVPVYACEFCSDDFNHEPFVPEDMHLEEAKKKGLTFCSAAHLRAALELLEMAGRL